MSERPIQWVGDPICYKREDGSALIVGRFHYLFDKSGAMTSAQPVTRPILATILQHLYKDKALAMAAYVQPIPEPAVYTEEEMQVREAALQLQLSNAQSQLAAAQAKLGE